MADGPKSRKGIGGQNCKLTPEVQERIVSAIKAGNYAMTACAYAGISDSTYYEWLQRGEQRDDARFIAFRDAVKQAEAQAEVRAVTLVQQAMPDNWAAAMTWLERRFPERWGRREGLLIKIGRMSDDELISRATGVLDGVGGTGPLVAEIGPEPEPLPE